VIGGRDTARFAALAMLLPGCLWFESPQYVADFDTGSSCGAGESWQLDEIEDLGSSVGAAVATGNNSSADMAGSRCGLTHGVPLRWSAPATDIYRFTTEGSNFDTVLALTQLDGGCECNDDADDVIYSELEASVDADGTVVVIVGGLWEYGNYVLGIHGCTTWSDTADVAVNAAEDPVEFSWSGGSVSNLVVTTDDDVGTVVWSIQCNEEPISDPSAPGEYNPANCIESPVDYGQVPDNAEPFSATGVLQDNTAYRVTITRYCHTSTPSSHSAYSSFLQ